MKKKNIYINLLSYSDTLTFLQVIFIRSISKYQYISLIRMFIDVQAIKILREK